MILVPVLDLKGGQVVHAKAGQRDDYRPLRSVLCPGSDPAAVTRALLGLFPFKTLYAADLDRIEGSGDNDPALAAIRGVARDAEIWAEIWIDGGFASAADVAAFSAKGLGVPVLGSESLADNRDFAAVLTSAGPDAVLSLDFSGDRFVGPPALLDDTASWPRRVIVMQLARVGQMGGPDFARVAAACERAGPRLVFAAGGVRNLGDLAALRGTGAAGALIATALHTGAIAAAELKDFDRTKRARLA
ncbi:MAG: HisA/HisF-related TIM barrel protein [Alphaproteobacteria bacterium]